MSELPMQGHFRYLSFKTFLMTPRTPQCKVFWALLSSSEHSGVPEDSKPPTFPNVGFHPHTWPKWGCDIKGLSFSSSSFKSFVLLWSRLHLWWWSELDDVIVSPLTLMYLPRCKSFLHSTWCNFWGYLWLCLLEKMLHQDLNDQCWMIDIFLRVNLYCSHHHLCLKGCPSHQLSLQLFKHDICLIYNVPFHSCHNGYGIFITKVIDIIPLIKNKNKCKETNFIRFFHLIDTPLFYINICS